MAGAAVPIRLKFVASTDRAFTAQVESIGRDAAARLDATMRRVSNRIGPGLLDKLLGRGGVGAVDGLRASLKSTERQFLSLDATLGKVNKGAGGFQKGFRSIRDVMTTTAATIYATKAALSGLNAVLVRPIRGAAREILDATEAYRRFEISISGVVGGMQRAKALNHEIVRAAQGLPITVAGMQGVAQRMGFTPALTSDLALGSGREAAGRVADMAKLVNKLAILDPEQGEAGALFALREGLAGEFISLKRRLEILPEQVGQAIGATVEQLKGDPHLFLEALNAYVSQVIPDDALAKMSGLYSVRVAKLKDAWTHAAAILGDSGIFDRVVSMLEGATQRLLSYFDSPQWRTRAQSISANLERILGGVSRAVVAFLNAMTGGKSDSLDPDRFADDIERITRAMGAWSETLPEAARAFGAFVGEIKGYILSALDSVREAAEASKNPLAAAVAPIRRPAIEWLSGIGGDVLSSPVFSGVRADGIGLPSNPNAAKPRPATQPAALPPMPRPFYESLEGDARAAWDRYTQGVRRVDDFGRLFASQYRSAQSAVAGMPGSYSDEGDDFARQYGAGRRGLSIAGKAFGSVRAGRDDMLGSIDNARRELERVLVSSTGTPHAAALQNYLDSALPGDVASVNKAYDAQTRAVADALRGATIKWAEGLAGALEDQSPAVRAILFDRIARGATDVQADVRRALAGVGVDAGELGFAGMDLRGQTAFLNARLAGEAAGIKTGGRSERETNLALLRMYSGHTGDARGVLDRARAAYAQSPTDLNLTALGRAQQTIAEITANVRELELATNTALRGLVDFGRGVEEALEGGLGNAINSLISGTGSLRDALLGFTQDVTRAFSQMAARNLMAGLFGGNDFASGGAGLLTGLFGSMFGGSGGGGNPFSGQAAYNARAFADGGIVTRPTLAIAGERGAEAFIPLKSGAVPVVMNSEPAVEIVVVNSWDAAVARSMHRHRAIIVDSVSGDIRRGGRVNKAIRRAPA